MYIMAYGDTTSSTEKKKPVQKKLTPAQNKKLQEHKQHHSPKHMAMMRRLMRQGSSFSQAHKMAQKSVGK
tara:strand:- start:314 stop:523 length:210 start_codon:yes stop_codon:yes gene_type:complete